MIVTPGPAGWYPQADGSQRYWDGLAWTPHVTPAQAAYPPSPGGTTLYPQDGQPWPPIPTSPGRYAAGPSPLQSIAYQPAHAYAPKSPGLALIASFLVPGLGQLVNGEIGKGIVFLLAYLAAIVSVVLLIGFVLVPVLWVWAMVDAYRSAKAWNLAHGILS
jgi:TM2 domain-containing membrane protein YozV